MSWKQLHLSTVQTLKNYDEGGKQNRFGRGEGHFLLQNQKWHLVLTGHCSTSRNFMSNEIQTLYVMINGQGLVWYSVNVTYWAQLSSLYSQREQIFKYICLVHLGLSGHCQSNCGSLYLASLHPPGGRDELHPGVVRVVGRRDRRRFGSPIRDWEAWFISSAQVRFGS